MSAYGNLDTAIAGLTYGIKGRKEVESWNAAESINFGVPCFSYAGEDFSDGTGDVYNAKQDTSTITLDADLVALNVITTTITIDGVAQDAVATTFATTHDATMTAHAAAIEAAISGVTVTLTDATDNRQFTVFYKGHNINLITSPVTAGGSQAGVTIAYTTAQIFIGFSAFTQKSNVADVGYYAQYETVNVLTYGMVYALTSVAVNANTAAYAIWAVTNQTKLTGTATSNYDINCRFRSTLAAAGLALVEVKGQNTDATP
jgi:hypothetical protein